MIKTTIRISKNTNQQLENLAKDNSWSRSKVIRFILNKSLSNYPSFKPNLVIKRFKILRIELAKIEEDLSQLNSYFAHGFSNLNQIAKTLNILVKNESMTNDLYGYFVYSLNGLNLKQSLKLVKQMNNKINVIWNLLNREMR